MVKKLLVAIFGILFLSVSLTVIGYKGGYTSPLSGAPGEGTCTSCHSGTAISAGAKHSTITLTSNFTGNGYIPDSTYVLAIKYKQTGKYNWGFQITSLDKSNTGVGTFTANDSRTQTFTSGSRSYATQTNSGYFSNDTIEWKIKWKAPSSNIGNIKFYLVLNASNGNGNDGSGDSIYTKNFTIAPSTLLPTCKAKLNKDTVVCTGVTNEFGFSATGSPTSYSWSFPNGSPTTSTSATPKVSYASSGAQIAILKVKNNKGFSLPDTFKFTVKTGATAPSINPSGTRNLCKGDTLTVNGGVASGHTLSWSNNASGSSIKVLDSGTFFTIATASNGCKRNSNNLRVNIFLKPTISTIEMPFGDTACQFGPIKMIIHAKNTDSFWNPNTNKYQTDSNIVLPTSTAGSFSALVSAKNKGGCVAQSTKKYVIVPFNKVSLGAISNRTLSGFKVNWNAYTGATGYKVSENNGSTWITPSSGNSGLSHTISGLNPNTSKKVLVKAILPKPCLESDTNSIIGTSLPCQSLVFTIEGDTDYCVNTSGKFKLRGLKGKNASVFLDNNYQGKDTIITLTPQFNNNHVVSVIDSNNLACGTYSQNLNLKVTTIQLAIGSAALDICKNIGSTYNYTFSSNSNADSIRMFKNNSAIGGWVLNAPQNITISHNDSIWCTFKKEKCIIQKVGIKKVKMVGNLDLSYTTAITNNYSYKFNPTVTTGNHEWYVKTLSSALVSPTFDFTPYKGTTVTVKHKINNSPTCLDSASTNVNVADAKIKNINGDLIKLYPNPTNSVLQIDFKNNKYAVVNLYNSIGVLVYSIKNPSNTLEINVKQLPAGIYTFTAQGKEFISVQITKY